MIADRLIIHEVAIEYCLNSTINQHVLCHTATRTESVNHLHVQRSFKMP